MNLLKELFLIFYIIIRSKKYYKVNKNIDLLVYNTEKNLFENFLENNNFKYHYLNSNLNKINILIFIKTLFKFFFLNIKFRSLYVIEYIKVYQPKLVITFSDNNLEFYKFKKYIPNIKFSFVQNGLRASSFDVFEKFENNEVYEVDYMFVFNESIGKEYNKYIKGKYFVVGSLKNNFVEILEHKTEKSIVYISQYTSEDSLDDIMLDSQINGKVTFREFYKHERIILPYIKDFCKENDFNFKIIGRPSTKFKIKKEKQYYDSILKDFDWIYIKSEKSYDSYKLINQNALIITACCTMGVESLSRDKKIIFFPVRSKKISDVFGWPVKFEEEGFFWCTDNSKENFNKLINNVINININDWKKIIKPYKQKLMLYDHNNYKFKKIISDILV